MCVHSLYFSDQRWEGCVLYTYVLTETRENPWFASKRRWKEMFLWSKFYLLLTYWQLYIIDFCPFSTQLRKSLSQISGSSPNAGRKYKELEQSFSEVGQVRIE